MPHHKRMLAAGQPSPTGVRTARFVVRPLVVSDSERDFEAWSTSIDELQGIFGPDSSWPSPDMTLEENTIDLAWHQVEYSTGGSYAFTVFTPDGDRCLGCVYISPARKQKFDVEMFWWVRADEAATGLDAELASELRRWMNEQWPWSPEKIACPGRDIAWEDYGALDNQPHW